jgi:hypothetical protein
VDVSKVPDLHPDRQPPRQTPRRRRPARDVPPVAKPEEKRAEPAKKDDGHIDVTV